MYTPNNPSDQQLFSLIRLGNEEAFSILYERYRKYLLLLAYVALRNEEEARDIVQETFISLWKKARDLDEGIPLRPYLEKMVRHKCIDHIRKNNSSRGRDSLYCAYNDQHTTNTLLEDKELAMLLNNSIARIPSASRLAFELSYLHNKPHRKIAAVMKINVQSVKNHISRALKLLRKNLEKQLF